MEDAERTAEVEVRERYDDIKERQPRWRAARRGRAGREKGRRQRGEAERSQGPVQAEGPMAARC